MNAPDKLQALIDLVFQNPLEKTVVEDADGNKRVVYQKTTLQQGVPFEEIISGIHVLQNYSEGKTFRKNSLVRKGLNDYFCSEETSTDPQSDGPWVLVRENNKGPAGDDGEDYTL